MCIALVIREKKAILLSICPLSSKRHFYSDIVNKSSNVIQVVYRSLISHFTRGKDGVQGETNDRCNISAGKKLFSRLKS